MDSPECIICRVCGDGLTAKCHRLYGATNICYSCRIFFRRIVTSNQIPCCVNKGQATVDCVINIETRNLCKGCRYKKCLSVGLLPNLVNTKSRKPYTRTNQKLSEDLPVLLSKPKTVINIVMPRPFGDEKYINVQNFDKETILKRLSSEHDEIFFNYNDHGFHREIAELSGICIEQMRQEKARIYVPPELNKIGYQFMLAVVRKSIQIFLPDLSSHTEDELQSSLSLSLAGIAFCLADCCTAKNLLDQIDGKSFGCSEKYRNFYKDKFPDIERLEAVPMEKYDTYAKHVVSFSDEELLSHWKSNMNNLVGDDQHLCQLLHLLVLFSPVNVNLEERHKRLLKEYQQKISIMIYTHLMNRDGAENLEVLLKMTTLTSMIDDFHKLGKQMVTRLLPQNEDAQNAHNAQLVEILVEDITDLTNMLE